MAQDSPASLCQEGLVGKQITPCLLSLTRCHTILPGSHTLPLASNLILGKHQVKLLMAVWSLTLVYIEQNAGSVISTLSLPRMLHPGTFGATVAPWSDNFTKELKHKNFKVCSALKMRNRSLGDSSVAVLVTVCCCNKTL